MRTSPKKIDGDRRGGRVGLIRGEVAARHPEGGWIGIAEKTPTGPSWWDKIRRGLRGRPTSTKLLKAGGECGDSYPPTSTSTSDPAGRRRARHSPSWSRSRWPPTAECAAGAGTPSSAAKVDRRDRLHAALPAAAGCRQGKGAHPARWATVTMVTSRAFMNRLVAIDNTGARPTGPDLSHW